MDMLIDTVFDFRNGTHVNRQMFVPRLTPSPDCVRLFYNPNFEAHKASFFQKRATTLASFEQFLGSTAPSLLSFTMRLILNQTMALLFVVFQSQIRSSLLVMNPQCLISICVSS